MGGGVPLISMLLSVGISSYPGIEMKRGKVVKQM